MKKQIVTIAIALMMGFGFSSFAGENTSENNQPAEVENTVQDDPMLYWFDGATYLGYDTKENIQNNHCGPEGSQECADGFVEVDSNLQPIGQRADNTTKQ